MPGDPEEQQPLVSNTTPQRIYSPRRKIIDPPPLTTWALIGFEFCERCAYFGLVGPLQNYLQLSYSDSVRPGGLGLGQANATLMKMIFACWCNTTPIMAAIVADQYLGRRKTICLASWVYLLGLGVLWWSSMHALSLGTRRLLLLPAMLLIGLGAGGIKANSNALLAEQYQAPASGWRELESGEVVDIDCVATVHRIIMTAYVLTNIGALSPVIAAYVEVSPLGGFSAAFLLPPLVLTLGIVILFTTKRHYKISHPTDSVVLHFLKVLVIASHNNWSLSAAEPSLHPSGSASCMFGTSLRVTYNEGFPNQVREAVRACFVFAPFPIYWAAYVQMLSTFISQAGTMDDHGIPNDLLASISPITVVLIALLLDRVILPWLRRRCCEPSVSFKICLGFLVCSASMAWAAAIQAKIYGSPPCYHRPRTNECSQANHVHILLQVPAYLLMACSEVLVSATGLQFAFTHAPPTMRSLVMSAFLSTSALGALLSIAFRPLLQHNSLVWLFGSISTTVGTVGLSLPFWLPLHQPQLSTSLAG